MSKIPMVWTADLKTKEEKEQFTKDVYTWINTAVGKKFLAILDRQLETIDTAELKPDIYECPSWANKQAHLNGYRQHIIEVFNLLKFAEE